MTPNFWTDPTNGIPYYLTVQTPEYRIQNVDDLNGTPISSTSGSAAPVPSLFGNVASFKRLPIESVYNQTNIQSAYDVYGSAQDRDLGGVTKDIQVVVDELQGKMPLGNQIVVTGQIQSMDGAFANLTLGLLFAAVFVYMLMVVNYQSFVDPLAVVLALPGAGCGIILMPTSPAPPLACPRSWAPSWRWASPPQTRFCHEIRRGKAAFPLFDAHGRQIGIFASIAALIDHAEALTGP